MDLHLIHFRVSHYNEKVRWALDHKRLPHTREARIPGLHIRRARKLTQQTKLPILVLDGKPLAGSAQIVAELERLHPEPALFPADEAGRVRAREIEAYFDEEVAPAVRRLFWSTYLPHGALCARMATDGFSRGKRLLWRGMLPIARRVMGRNMQLDRERLEEARANLGSYIDRIESQLGPTGYLIGDRFGVADLAVAAVMSAILRPPEFPYPLPEPWPPELTALRDSIAGRRGARWVFDIYRRHRGTSAERPAL